MSELWQQLLQAEQSQLTTQQLQSFDSAKLINMYAKVVPSAFLQEKSS